MGILHSRENNEGIFDSICIWNRKHLPDRGLQSEQMQHGTEVDEIRLKVLYRDSLSRIKADSFHFACGFLLLILFENF